MLENLRIIVDNGRIKKMNVKTTDVKEFIALVCTQRRTKDKL